MRAKCDPELTRGSDTGVWQVGAASVRRQKWQPRIRGRDSQESQGSSSDLDESYFKTVGPLWLGSSKDESLVTDKVGKSGEDKAA